VGDGDQRSLPLLTTASLSFSHVTVVPFAVVEQAVATDRDDEPCTFAVQRAARPVRRFGRCRADLPDPAPRSDRLPALLPVPTRPSPAQDGSSPSPGPAASTSRSSA